MITKRKISILTLIMMSMTIYAQTVLHGKVVEYRGKQSKMPLANVEVAVFNAGSAVTDKHGRFTLNFRTLKPGDKVHVRRIVKPSFEVFNLLELSQWNISRNSEDVFVIEMCKSDYIRQLRDQYLRSVSARYAQQQQKREQELAQLKKEGKLNETEYKEKLKRLQDEYDDQLDRIESYIERFVHIDLSKLSEREARIIDMVNKGDFDGAVKAYDELHLEQQYKQAVDTKKKAEAAIDSLTRIRVEHVQYLDSLKKMIDRENEFKNNYKNE